MERVLDAEKSGRGKSNPQTILKPSSPSNRMFNDKENNRPTLIIDTDPKPFEFPTIVPDQKGFGTNLKPSESKSRALKGTDQLEACITDMETQLIQLALYENNNNKYKPNSRAKEIRDIAKQVSEQDCIIVPTDKRNSFTVMQTEDYKQKVLKHLLKDGKEISRERLIQAKEQANELLEEINRLCSKRERDFVQESLKSKAIPSPKLLVKDHKKKDKWVNTQPVHWRAVTTDLPSD
jgi:hypothetical protein